MSRYQQRVMSDLEETLASLSFKTVPSLTPLDSQVQSGEAILPDLPDGYEAHGCHYVLGWTEIDHLQALGRAYYKGDSTRQVDWDCIAMAQLKLMAGYHNLYWASALPDDVLVPPPAYAGRPQGCPLVFAILSSATMDSPSARLSQAQYDWLVAAFDAISPSLLVFGIHMASLDLPQ
ncbi:hypothetical protein POSPLADRAFT_1154920 [Postia placenta MAD-698-R-SB12]|uniref:Uncharacterized protein n=1 Tax=Postia placenta MAD-698-R-SB12 TaxID=670580 RepID=A0A1X6MNC6_9APHY|nr:hypothetical protein POSPLADRAFT_1154920 [Postia placenta MAD-698-R-SB12]OSX57917.1 hypothetical protein POSPLADRAFT_1154920 [Postia placenta MAD-698-R-SB12]